MLFHNFLLLSVEDDTQIIKFSKKQKNIFSSPQNSGKNIYLLWKEHNPEMRNYTVAHMKSLSWLAIYTFS